MSMTPREELRQIIKATSSALPIPAQAAVGMVAKRLDTVLANYEVCLVALDNRLQTLERGNDGNSHKAG